jgi:hypothetical protein
MAKKTVPSVSANPTLPSVSVDVGGVTYSLCFDFNAMAQAEAATGLNLLQCLNFQNLNTIKVRGLLYAAMLKAHPETTLEMAGMLFNHPNTVDKLMNAVVEAYLGSQPEPEAEPKNVPEPEKS